MDIIICDLDGTLLNSKQEISERTLEQLTFLKQKYHFCFILCTGRHLFSTKKVAYKILNLVNYYITQNGALIYDSNFHKLVEENLSNKLFKELYFKFSDNLEEVCIYDGDKALCFIDYENFTKNSPAKGIKYYKGNIFTYKKAVNKIVFVAKKEVLEKLKLELVDYDEKIEYFLSRDTFLDINKKGVNKGQAISNLLKDLNKNNVYIFGDNDNDKEMLSLDYNTIAMKNGSILAKEVSKEITKYTNDEDGVIRYLKTKLGD